jgi:hypothetical protein
METDLPLQISIVPHIGKTPPFVSWKLSGKHPRTSQPSYEYSIHMFPGDASFVHFTSVWVAHPDEAAVENRYTILPISL